MAVKDQDYRLHAASPYPLPRVDQARPTQSVPEMRQWVNGATAMEEGARRVWGDIQAQRAAGPGQIYPPLNLPTIPAGPPQGPPTFNGMDPGFMSDLGRNYDQEQHDAFRQHTIAQGGEDPGPEAYQRRRVIVGAEAAARYAPQPAINNDYASGYAAGKRASEAQRPYGFLAPPPPFISQEQERKENAEQLRKLAEMMKVKPSGCPRCGYPDTKDGSHYKGIYLPGQPCDLCGLLESGARAQQRSPLGAFRDDYREAIKVAAQDASNRRPPKVEPLSARECVRLRDTFCERGGESNVVQTTLAIWRLLATIDSLMAEKETV